MKIPFHITEFGACLTEAPCTQEIRQVTEVADEFLVGWAYWEFKNYEDLTTSAGTGSEGFYNQDGSLQSWKVKAMARTYMMFSQGTPIKNFFDMDSGFFEGKLKVNTEIEHPTRIYFSQEYYYNKGISFKVSLNGMELVENQYNLNKSEYYVEVQITDPALNGEIVEF